MILEEQTEQRFKAYDASLDHYQIEQGTNYIVKVFSPDVACNLIISSSLL